MTFYKIIMLLTVSLMSITVSAEEENKAGLTFSAYLMAMGGTMMIDATGSHLLRERVSPQSQSNVVDALSNSLALSDDVKRSLVGSSVTYTGIVDGENVTISQTLKNMEDVEIFDQNRLNRMRLSKASRIDARLTPTRSLGATKAQIVLNFAAVASYAGSTLGLGRSVLPGGEYHETLFGRENLQIEEVQVGQ